MKRERNVNLIPAILTILPAIICLILNPGRSGSDFWAVTEWIINAIVAVSWFYVVYTQEKKDLADANFDETPAALIIEILVYFACVVAVSLGIKSTFLRAVILIVMWLSAYMMGISLVKLFWKKYKSDVVAEIRQNGQPHKEKQPEPKPGETTDGSFVEEGQEGGNIFYCVPRVSGKPDITKAISIENNFPALWWIMQPRWLLGVIMGALLAAVPSFIILLIMGVDAKQMASGELWAGRNIPTGIIVTGIVALVVFIFVVYMQFTVIREELQKKVARQVYGQSDFEIVEKGKWHGYKLERKKLDNEAERISIIVEQSNQQAVREVKRTTARSYTCPVCQQGFTPARLVQVPQYILDELGTPVMQCPNCQHIWNTVTGVGIQNRVAETVTGEAEENLSTFELDFGAICKYTGDRKVIIISEKIGGTVVTGIGVGAFRDRGLVKVILPNTIQVIYDDAFSMNRLTSIDIPDSVNRIFDHAFADNRLTRVSLSKNLTKLGSGVFVRNPLKSVVVPFAVMTRSQELKMQLVQSFDTGVELVSR